MPNVGQEPSHHCSFVHTFTLTPKWGLVLTAHTVTHSQPNIVKV